MEAAGIIGEATTKKNGLMPKSYVNNTVYTDSGGYAIAIDFNNYNGAVPALVYGSNSPSGNAARYHILIQWIGSSSAIQFALDYETNTLYVKSRIPNGGWASWKGL